MSQPFILAIDEGTTNAKAIAVSKLGEVLSKGSVPVELAHPNAGWAEQDPEAIWNAAQSAIEACLQQLDAELLAGIAISNQRESVLIWDRSTGQALTPLVSWQCRRSEEICAEIAKKPEAELVKKLTGSVIDPLFPASKIRWLLDHLENGTQRAIDGELCVGTVDSWLVWKLTGGQQFVTDVSNASRYQLFNISTFSWDPLLLDLYQIPEQCLPSVIASTGERGVTVGLSTIKDGIPVLAQAGDSHAALYGQGGFNPGVVKATYGTGSSLMVRINELPKNDYGVSTTVAWDDGKPSLAMEGNITHTGSAIKFISKILGISDITKLSELAWSVTDSSGVFFVPALAGLGAPHWDAKARGLITGLTDAATPAHIARSAFESVAYQVADLFFAMQLSGGAKFSALSVDGGPSKNVNLMQFQADLLQVPIIRSETTEVSALGAAFMAGRTLQWWPEYRDLDALSKEVQVIKPNPENTVVLENYKLWKVAIDRARYSPN
ncbi:FGGY family carbohydrate kinase [Vibrio diazotrophicus]|uniref:ATP:glycerol 3-phosphotransferase n=1 Tax=Vibrio diazotrophicus TaxID=685 RepID=A0A2J8GQZ9_VIBDI|nr:FGGY-family carbohydrate kinase [Vibrio diazotrophicus]PNH88443.1 glycerol kinase [Vibrio diazotrophicus]PNI01585.1 glycerol kinase [Vibrio diazotrophicus]